MTVQLFEPVKLREMLAAQIRSEIDAEIAKIADAAAEQARKAVLAKADALALTLLQHYDVQRRGEHLVIEVRK